MELLQLIYFRDAAKLENFSKVAEKYYVAQPAISHTISRLEDELGVKLFTRNGKKIVLNEYGKAFLEGIDVALEKIEHSKNRIANLKDNTINISIREGKDAIIPMLASFREKYPEIDVSFPDRVDGTWLNDILISARPFANDEDYTSMPLFTERLVVAIPENSPLAEKKALSIDDIRSQPMIAHKQNSKMQRQISAYFEDRECTPNVIISSSTNATIANYVRHGFGIAFFPEISCADVLSRGIITRPFADYDCKRTIYLSIPKSSKPSFAAEKFIEFASRYFEKYKS